MNLSIPYCVGKTGNRCFLATMVDFRQFGMVGRETPGEPFNELVHPFAVTPAIDVSTA